MLSKKNFIISLITFCCAFIVFASTVFAWFTSTKDNNLDNITPEVTSLVVEANLYVLGNEDWTLVNKEMFDDFVNPGDFMYFKVVVSADKGKDARINSICFNNFNTVCSSELLVDELNNVYVKDFEDNKIIICNLDNNVYDVNSKTVYEYKNEVLELKDYKLEDVICVYDLNKASRSSMAYNDKTCLEGLEYLKLSDSILINEDIENGSTNSYYFALEVNYDLMKESDIDYSCLYMYQLFTLGKVVVNVN